MRCSQCWGCYQSALKATYFAAELNRNDEQGSHLLDPRWPVPEVCKDVCLSRRPTIYLSSNAAWSNPQASSCLYFRTSCTSQACSRRLDNQHKQHMEGLYTTSQITCYSWKTHTNWENGHFRQVWSQYHIESHLLLTVCFIPQRLFYSNSDTMLSINSPNPPTTWFEA